MAGDWIKMRTNLWDDPRVSAVADQLDCSEALVVGGLYWLWTVADNHTEDGFLPGISYRTINRKTGIDGFAEAISVVGWLEESEGGVVIPKFDEHNGKSAKKRAQDARRMETKRSEKPTKQGESKSVRDLSHSSVTKSEQECDKKRTKSDLEKRREEKEKNIKTPLNPPGGESSGSPKTSADLQIPEAIDTPEVRTELDEWLAHRQRIRKPYKSADSINARIAEYLPRGPDALIAALRHSRQNEYQGIFDPKGQASDSGRKSNPAFY